MSFTIEPLRRIIKESGAPRVSDGAASALAAVLEARVGEIVVEAAKIATHADRRTVLAEDIKLARKVMEAKIQPSA